VKPSEVDMVSLEISHISLAMDFFFFKMLCGFTCFTLQAVLRINVLHKFILLLEFICYKNRSC